MLIKLRDSLVNAELLTCSAMARSLRGSGPLVRSCHNKRFSSEDSFSRAIFMFLWLERQFL